MLDIAGCPKLVANVDPLIAASCRLSAVAKGVVRRLPEAVRSDLRLASELRPRLSKTE
jgi:hypothetical protein